MIHLALWIVSFLIVLSAGAVGLYALMWILGAAMGKVYDLLHPKVYRVTRWCCPPFHSLGQECIHGRRERRVVWDKATRESAEYIAASVAAEFEPRVERM